ncbi:MAG: cytochrome c3 family protein [bacterium]
MRAFQILAAFACLGLPTAALGQSVPNPHYDPDTGVLREITVPSTRGECSQCHLEHGGDLAIEAHPELLFTENSNRLAYWSEGASPCHAMRPTNYPLTENDRLPEDDPDAGYFEANVGGVRTTGVEFRGRWPGEAVYSNPTVLPGAHLVSPHAWDPDMPVQDVFGEGACANCHDPHGERGHFDLLVKPYRGIGGAESSGPPQEYGLCFSCHGTLGAFGMERSSRFLADYYDRGLNGDTAGHQIRMNHDIAISWPANVQVGDMLPCSDCHNAHGSEGNNRVEPNAYLLSDQRPGWSGLTNPRGDPEQNRRFCLGCHIPSDGIPGSQSVEGIVMNTLPDEDGHDSLAPQACSMCHGRDYSGPDSFNVHHPNDDPEGGAFGEGLFD